MKTVIKNVYYCDFCNKRGLSKPMMARHEHRCTRNPNRECFMCGDDHDLPSLIERFKKETEIKEIKDGNADIGYWNTIEAVKWPKIGDIEDAVECCPACTMAILKQAGLTHYYLKDKIPYNFQESKKEWWEHHNNYGSNY